MQLRPDARILPVSRNSTNKTVLLTCDRLYELLRIAADLSNASAKFQEGLNNLFSTLRHDKLVHYLEHKVNDDGIRLRQNENNILIFVLILKIHIV